MLEIDEKVDRLARIAGARRLGGILINTQPNFAWLTGGRSNQSTAAAKAAAAACWSAPVATTSSSPTISRCLGCSRKP